ncbi:hypothetical protein GCM10009672_26300 [Nesterenkonia lutea]
MRQTLDVKKFGGVPAGGGGGPETGQTREVHNTGRQRMGFDYIHVAVDRICVLRAAKGVIRYGPSKPSNRA